MQSRLPISSFDGVLVAETNLLYLVLPVIDVLHELPAIAVSHTWVGMPHPVVDQDLPYLTALENGFTETPENIEQRSCLISAHLLENEVEIVPADAAWIEHRSVRRLKEKATLSIVDEVAPDVLVGAPRFELGTSCAQGKSRNAK